MSLQGEKTSAPGRLNKHKECGCWILAALNSRAGSGAYKLGDLK